MSEMYQLDLPNKRQYAMWVESGIQFRSNLLLCDGATIEQHIHDFSHVSLITWGWLWCKTISPDNNIRKFQVASKGFKPDRTDIAFEPETYRITVPAFYRHSFEVIECQGQPAEVLCLLPEVA